MALSKRVKKREFEAFYSPEIFQRHSMAMNSMVQNMRHSVSLQGHDGCVNTINWNESGTLIASGSDDLCVIIWGEDRKLIRKLKTAHTNNIFSVQFVPDTRDRLVLSAAGDHTIFLYDIEHMKSDAASTLSLHRWSECNNRVKRLVVNRSTPRTFWSASEDGIVRQYDLRDNKSLDLIDLSNDSQLKTIASNEMFPELLALGLNDPTVPIYDRRKLNEPILRLIPSHLLFAEDRIFRHPLVTHLDFNREGTKLVANIGSDNIYIFDTQNTCKRSPQVFSLLQRFLKEDSNNFIFSRNGTIETKNRFLDFSHDKRKDQSWLIDRCSSILSEFVQKNNNANLVSLLNLESKNIDTSIQGSWSHLQELDLVKCLITRGKSYAQRGWEGDYMAALRDFIAVLNICVDEREAHQRLIETLCGLKQWDLARTAYRLYQKKYAENETNSSAKKIMRKLGSIIDNGEEGSKKDGEQAHLWSKEQDKNQCRDYIRRFTGHSNVNTDIKEAKWFGGNDEYIVAGSDCGHVFVWDVSTESVVRMFKADNYTVNCIQPHPRRFLLATSGIDDVVRIWEPSFMASNIFINQDFSVDNEIQDKITCIYEQMKKNRRPLNASVWEQLFLGMGIEFIQRAQEDDEGMRTSEPDIGSENNTIRCRTM